MTTKRRFTPRVVELLALFADMDANDWASVPEVELNNMGYHAEYEKAQRRMRAVKDNDLIVPRETFDD